MPGLRTFQFSVEIAIVSRKGICVTTIVKISAGSSGPRRRHRSALDIPERGLTGLAVGAVATTLLLVVLIPQLQYGKVVREPGDEATQRPDHGSTRRREVAARETLE